MYTTSRSPDHPDLAITFSGLSQHSFARERYAEADDYYEQAMNAWKSKHRTGSPETEASDRLAPVPGEPSGSGADLQHDLEALDAAIGPEQGKDIATVSSRLANACIEQGRYPEAREILWHALDLSEKTRGKKDLVTVYCLGNLARFSQSRKENDFAEFLYERPLQLVDVEFRFKPIGTLQICANYIQFLRETGREQRAAKLEKDLEVLKHLPDRESS